MAIYLFNSTLVLLFASTLDSGVRLPPKKYIDGIAISFSFSNFIF